MKSVLLSGIALISFVGGSAVAADLPVKAKPVVCVACNWNGFYVGVNVGGGIGHDPSGEGVSFFPPGATGGAAP